MNHMVNIYITILYKSRCFHYINCTMTITSTTTDIVISQPIPSVEKWWELSCKGNICNVFVHIVCTSWQKTNSSSTTNSSPLPPLTCLLFALLICQVDTYRLLVILCNSCLSFLNLQWINLIWQQLFTLSIMSAYSLIDAF